MKCFEWSIRSEKLYITVNLPYSYRLDLFMSWCTENQVDAPQVLQYLQGLLQAGKSPSTLRGMVVAIKAYRVGGNS